MTDTTTRTPKQNYTRRRLLGAAATGGAALATGAWAAASGLLDAGGSGGGGAGLIVLPPNVRKALAAPPPSAQSSISDIKHVVLLMQENRSFDHYFGTMSGVAGFSDPNAITLSTGRSVFYQPTDTNPDGYLLPFHLDSQTTSAQKIPSTGHGWLVQHAAWNGGKMDSWLPAHYQYDRNKQNVPFIMGYYDETDLPFHRALADAFTICDRYHCSMMGPTSPNRIYWESGTINPPGGRGGPLLGNEPGVRRWRAYAEDLTDAGVSWKFYQVPGGMQSATRYFSAFQNPSTSSPLYKNSRQVAVDQFARDAMADRLATVSWLWPGPGQNEHPNESMPAAGAKFISDTIDAIAANPEVWAKTVFILVYDENDGLFDHVPPPTPPAGTDREFVYIDSPTGIPGMGYPIGGGFRVPCIIVSPWTAGGWVCSEPFDHTSCLQFLEVVTGVRASNVTPWRRQTFGDLTSAFRFQDPASAPSQLPDADAALALAEQQVATLPPPIAPTSNQVPPAQQPGQRPTVPERSESISR
ncbi:alkaline phosphatase family protein [Sphingomonas sp. DT-204]|uniref:alkaline phosphatase family protein n=1 Tax=Sphingomonas sp. DT-204 TaxID=3396166 RepID=UPI003F19798B